MILPGVPRFYGYPLVAYSFFGLFLASSFFLHSRGIFFPYWIEEFEASRTEMSAVVTFTLLTGNLLAPLMGYLVDRYPIKLIISTGAVWLGIGYFSLQYVDGYVTFFALLLVFQSVGWLMIGPLTHSKLLVNWFSRNRGMALGLAVMGISFAGIVMPGIAAFLAETSGWRNSYLLFACILVFLLLPLTLLVVKQSPSVMGQFPDGLTQPTESEQKAQPVRFEFTVYLEFLKSAQFWCVVVVFTLEGGVYSAMITHLPSYLTAELQYDLFDASYALGVAGIFAMIGKIVFGWMMDNLSSRTTVLVAVSCYFLSSVIFFSTASQLLIFLAAALFGLGFGGMEPTRSVLLSRIFGIAKFSRVSGLFSLLLAPATFWVLLTGYIADTFGSYVYAFQVWAVGFFIAAVVALLVRLPDRDES